MIKRANERPARRGPYQFPDAQSQVVLMSVDDLQSAVSHLPPDELARFSDWFENFIADQWDRQIEAHIAAGRLDAAGKKADEDFEAGKCTPL
jgi:hypothetical protein